MPFSALATRLTILAVFAGSMAIMPIHANAAETRLFEAEDGRYSFEYPVDFKLDYEFADGTGDVTGIAASSATNGDVSVTFVGPWDAGNLPDASEQTRQSIVEEFVRSIAVTPKITLHSSSMATMLGQPAVDMTFLNKTLLFQGKGTPAVNRYIVTVKNGKAYNFRCIYREDKATEFAPACDLAISTVKLQETPAKEHTDNAEGTAATSCTKLEFNKRKLQIVEFTSNMLMKDQSPTAIERMQNAHQKMTAIEMRVGDAPSEQDCLDIDTIVGTLK